jgi:subtilisin family serine protease
LHNTGQNVNGKNGTADADIDALEAWDVTTGSSDVVVAVIDSGVDINHPDLAANIWTNTAEIANNLIDDDGNGYVDDVNGWDFHNNDNAPHDPHGHGTHVAGTIAAVGDNATGVTGVSWSAKIMPLRFLDAFGVGDTANALDAIDYASAMGADVINNSWGGGGFSQALKDAIEASGAVVVCAAGNSGFNTDLTPHYPSSYNSANIISVAASDQDDQLAGFSNFGAVSVDVAAPGTNIYSSAPGRQTIWQDDFEDNDIGNWTTGGTNNTWASTNEEAYLSTYSLTDSPGANYVFNTDAWARTPKIDLTGRNATKLEFKLYGSSEIDFDFLFVEVSTNATSWTSINFEIAGFGFFNGVSGTAPFWLTGTADLGAYDGQDTVYVRFRLVSDNEINADGWYVDDVAVTAAASSYSGTEYQYLQGTSMATPHVAGLAALLKARNPALTHLEIKIAIEDNVDTIAALSGKVATGGRINAGKSVADPPSIVEFPIINFASDTIDVTYDEQGMQNALLEANYSFSPSMNFVTGGGSDDIAHLGNSTYRLSMASIPAYEIFTLTVSNITDLTGNAVTPNQIKINDGDSDSMADDWESDNSLNTSTDDSTNDSDGDGYTNYQEYVSRTNPRSAASAPFIVKDTIPKHKAGITNAQRVPHNTAFAVLLESEHGIDITDFTSVRFTIDDTVNGIYSRNLSNGTVRVIKLTADPNSEVTRMWLVYDRSEEGSGLQNFPYGKNVNLKIDATDSLGNTMNQESVDFNVETLAEHNAAQNPDNLPITSNVDAEDPDLGGAYDAGVESTDGDLLGAKIIYDSGELMTPAFGPMDEIPALNLSGVAAVGEPMNLQPPTVFDTPVKIFIPAPGYTDVSGLYVYYYNGSNWVPACDPAGNVLPGGDGWMVPGSRVDHNETDPAIIEIQVYHFSGAQAGAFSGASGGGGGGGCFISAANFKPLLTHLAWLILLNVGLLFLGTWSIKKIIKRR